MFLSILDICLFLFNAKEKTPFNPDRLQLTILIRIQEETTKKFGNNELNQLIVLHDCFSIRDIFKKQGSQVPTDECDVGAFQPPGGHYF